MIKQSVLLLSCLMVFNVANAQQTENKVMRSDMGQLRAPPPMNDAMKAELDNCATTVAKDPAGRPDRNAMHQCMESKGFSKPPRPEGPPPQMNNSQTPPLKGSPPPRPEARTN